MHLSPLKIINWNVGGAKFFEQKSQQEKIEFRKNINEALKQLIRRHSKPHIITLQEIVEYERPGEKRENIIITPDGYSYHSCILIDTDRHPYASKWKKVRKKGEWPLDTKFGQGNAILWRDDMQNFPIFHVPAMHIKATKNKHVEDVILMTGIYFGTRDTEPRAALVAHFMITKDLKTKRPLNKPLDIFVVNLHLTTLTSEREGIPDIDKKASNMRLKQLDIILDGIVSRYNIWRNRGYRFRDDLREPESTEEFDRHPPVWVIAGDFNFTPESLEYARIKRLNFVDVCPNKGLGTKGSGFGSDATLTCDYIFAGPKYIALDPMILNNAIEANPIPDYEIRVSDHYPLCAKIPLSIP